MKAVLEDLAQRLADAELSVREESAQELAELQSPDAIPWLLHALEDDAASVRMWGAYGLTRLARPEDLARLREGLEQESSSLVRVWCAYGLANSGDRQATTTLVGLLDDPDLDVRNNCADALLTLQRPAAALPHLQERLASADLQARAWAAGVLAGMGRPRALGLWREALLAPGSRVDAAVVASHLHAPEAARDLIRLAAELDEEELEAPVDRAAGAPLIQLLTTPLAALGLDTLLGEVEADPLLAGELLMILARADLADPAVIETIAARFESLPAKTVSAWQVLQCREQAPALHPALFTGWAAQLPGATAEALIRLPTATREALFVCVKRLAHQSDESLMRLTPLIALLKEGDFADRFGDLPELSLPDLPEFLTDPLGTALPDDEVTDFGEEETHGGRADEAEEMPELWDVEEDEGGEDLELLVQQLAAGEPLEEEQRAKAEAFLEELGMSAEEFVAEVEQGEAFDEEGSEGQRSAEQVAKRCLVLGALLHRWKIEAGLEGGRVKLPDAGRAIVALRAWLAEEGLEAALEPMEQDLLERGAGEWSEEERGQTAASIEGLQLLLWALGKLEDVPNFDVEADRPALLAQLPILKPSSDFVSDSELRDPEVVTRHREVYEMWLWRAEQEALARQVAAGEMPEAIDPEELVAELVLDGFPAEALEAELGHEGMLAEALRSLGRRAAETLAEEGALPKRIKDDFPFRKKAFFELDEDTIVTARTLAFERHRALSWIEHGGSWEVFSETFDEEEIG